MSTVRLDKLTIGGTAQWVIGCKPGGVPIAPDQPPSVQVYRGTPPAEVADAVTVTPVTGRDWEFRCSYTPAATTAGEVIEIEETLRVDGVDYPYRWSFRVEPAPVTTDDLTSLATGQDVTDAQAAIIEALPDSGGSDDCASVEDVTAARDAVLARLSANPPVEIPPTAVVNGVIPIHQGDAYVGDRAIVIPVPDPNRSLYDRLKGDPVPVAVWALAQGPARGVTVGTIRFADVAHDDDTGVTSVPVETPSSETRKATPGQAARWDLQIGGTGSEHTVARGTAVVTPDATGG